MHAMRVKGTSPDPKLPNFSETKIALQRHALHHLKSSDQPFEMSSGPCHASFRFRIKKTVTKHFLNHICKRQYECIHPLSAIILAWLQPYSPQKWLHLDVSQHCCCNDNNDNNDNDNNTESKVRACKFQTEILEGI